MAILNGELVSDEYVFFKNHFVQITNMKVVNAGSKQG